MREQDIILQIVEDETGTIEREYGPYGSLRADKMYDALLFRIDHERYTLVVERRQNVDPNASV